MKHMKSWVTVLLFVVCSGCVTTDSQYATYTSNTRLPSSYSQGTAMVGIGQDEAEPVEAFSIRGEHLLYKPANGGNWQTVEIESISGVQVRRNTRANRILSGALIGSSVGLGIGMIASEVHTLEDVSQTTATGAYPAAGALVGLLIGVGGTSFGNAPWDTYVPRREPNGFWRFVKEDI